VAQPRPALFVIAEAAEHLWEAEMSLGDIIAPMIDAGNPQERQHIEPFLDAVIAAQKAVDTAYEAALKAMSQLIAPWPDDPPRTP
jgi:hypothetical protein